MKKVFDKEMNQVIGGFDKSHLTEEEMKTWKGLIAEVEQIEAGQIAGTATQKDVDFANEKLYDFIRAMMDKYNMK